MSESVFRKKTRSDDVVAVSDLSHGQIVWVEGPHGREERVAWEGEILTQEERVARVESRAEANRRSNPYRRSFRSERSGHSLRWCF